MFERIELVNTKGQSVFIQLLAVQEVNYYVVNYHIGALPTSRSAHHKANDWGVGLIDDTLIPGGVIPEDIADIRGLIIETANRQYGERMNK